jgi:hypothetical protein
MSTERHGPTADRNTQITNLRELRRRAREISRDAQRDLADFQKPDGTFSTLPPPKAGKIHITTTCTALMALIAGRLLDSVCPSNDKQKNIATVFKHVVEHEWKSEGLEADNAFSVAFVLRAAGFLLSEGKMTRVDLLRLKHKGKSIEDIAKKVAKDAVNDFMNAFGVRIDTENQKETTAAASMRSYPPKAAIVYWYVDGVHSLKIDIGKAGWYTLSQWAATEFGQQIARVSADDDALMDPVSLMMAACLVARLKKIMNEHPSTDDTLAQLFPSKTELNRAVSMLFEHQRPSGIWPKYFPMFHFANAGANYCFTFEMLEALVSEMDPVEIFALPKVLSGFGRAANWCVLNRLKYKTGGREYSGWNSGGSITTLLASKPESWATATVHWFLHKLDDALSKAIQHAVLEKYGVVTSVEPDRRGWDALADADVEIQSTQDTVKTVLEREFITRLLTVAQDARLKIPDRRSALLFGPPGTAKTTLVRTLAEAVAWPCVEIRPSNFLERGLDNIYVVADEIFADLTDLSGAVIFFDEMDALVQSRNESLDATRQFLTTSMLPKLAGLHKEGRSVFFFATNYRMTFDEAITRPGRFDLLLCVGPPSWREKLKNVGEMVTATWPGRTLTRSMKPEELDAVVSQLRDKLKLWAQDKDLGEKLGRFTYDEMKVLIEELLKDTQEKDSLATAVAQLEKEEFVSKAQLWATKYIILRQTAGSDEKQNDNYSNFLADQSASRLQ